MIVGLQEKHVWRKEAKSVCTTTLAFITIPVLLKHM